MDWTCFLVQGVSTDHWAPIVHYESTQFDMHTHSS